PGRHGRTRAHGPWARTQAVRSGHAPRRVAKGPAPSPRGGRCLGQYGPTSGDCFYRRSASSSENRRFAGKAPVAQRIERSPPEREVACSNHAGRVEVLTAAAVRSTALVPFGAFFKGPSRTRTTRRLGASRLCVGVPPCRLLEPSLE